MLSISLKRQESLAQAKNSRLDEIANKEHLKHLQVLT